MKMSCKCQQHQGCMFSMNIINICQIQANPTCRYRQVEKNQFLVKCNRKTIYNCLLEEKPKWNTIHSSTGKVSIKHVHVDKQWNPLKQPNFTSRNKITLHRRWRARVYQFWILKLTFFYCLLCVSTVYLSICILHYDDRSRTKH